MQVTIEDITISFTVQYSKRKKITLEVTPEGLITVKAPLKTSADEITAFIHTNKKPLIALQKRLDNRKVIYAKKEYKQEEQFLYLGKVYSLEGLLKEMEIVFTDDMDLSALRQLVMKGYIQKTKEIVKRRVRHYESVIGVKSKSVTVVDSKTAWGTCNSLKDLTFNYRLSMAPESVIDYVVVHELCHILHMNHDRSFWRKVGMYEENYKEKQDYLARFGGVMTV